MDGTPPVDTHQVPPDAPVDHARLHRISVYTLEDLEQLDLTQIWADLTIVRQEYTSLKATADTLEAQWKQARDDQNQLKGTIERLRSILTKRLQQI